MSIKMKEIIIAQINAIIIILEDVFVEDFVAEAEDIIIIIGIFDLEITKIQIITKVTM